MGFQKNKVFKFQPKEKQWIIEMMENWWEPSYTAYTDHENNLEGRIEKIRKSDFFKISWDSIVEKWQIRSELDYYLFARGSPIPYFRRMEKPNKKKFILHMT